MFESWSVPRRIFSGFGIVILLTGALSVLAYVSSERLATALTGVDGATRETVMASRALEDVIEAEIAVIRFAMTGEEEQAQAFLENLGEVTNDLERNRATLAGHPALLQRFEAATRQAEGSAADFNEVRALRLRLEQRLAGFESTSERMASSFAELSSTTARAGLPTVSGGATQALGLVGDAQVRLLRHLLRGEAADADEALGMIDAARARLGLLAPDIDDPSLLALHAELMDNIAAYRTLATEVIAAAAQRSETRGALFGTLAEVRMAFKGIIDSTVEQSERHGAEGLATVGQTRAFNIGISTAILIVGVVTAWIIGRWIAGSINRQATAMTAIAGGALETEVHGAAYDHELGRMAKALTVFRENAKRVAALDVDKARARAEMMGELQDAFGRVVDAAVAGDFSARVDRRFADAELNTLADGVNRLVGTVESGLDETARVMSRIAQGQLGERMNGAYQGAFARLQDSVNATVSRLAQLVGEIAAASSDIEAATQEIAAGATQVSSRAEQQAASLEETSATMEELSSTVRANADSAARANEIAADAARRAAQGGEVADAAAAAMGAIERSSTRITEIVSLIDSIAFTTNLLALNASVEAARAGEAGRGFAVVAAEVRTLAQRSADAARDIRTLIEESASHVGVGVEQVGRTREALATVDGSIAALVKAIGEISAAGREQAAGVSEISSAVNHMDQMTQANAAMAEESASNAASLSEQAARLRGLVGAFSLGDGRSLRRAA